MQGQITVPDNELDALARRLGWTDFVIDPNNPTLEQPTLPNPIAQDQWVINKAQNYLNNEAVAAAANMAADSARQQAIETKNAIFSSIIPIVTTKSKAA